MLRGKHLLCECTSTRCTILRGVQLFRLTPGTEQVKRLDESDFIPCKSMKLLHSLPHEASCLLLFGTSDESLKLSVHIHLTFVWLNVKN